MKELIQKISSDPLLMLSSAIGVVVVLFVVLVVIIAYMRIKVYKERYLNTNLDSREREQRIETLEAEVHRLNRETMEQAQQLEAFSETKITLMQTRETLETTQKTLAEEKQEHAKVIMALDTLKEKYRVLQEEHEKTKKGYHELAEENNKLRVNNARLLMKIDREDQMASALQERNKHADDDGKMS